MVSARTCLVTLLVAATAFAGVAQAGDFTELLVVDCNSVAHVLPSQPWLHATVDATLVKQVLTYFQSALQRRAKCRCPSLTQAQVDEYFAGDLVGTLLRWAEPKPTAARPYASACNTLSTSFVADALSLGDSWDSALPSSCTSAQWAAGQPCKFSYAAGPSGTAAQARLDVVLDKCPNSVLPFVSVTCVGPRCVDLGRPCQADSDCYQNGECAEHPDVTRAAVLARLQTWLTDSWLFDTAEQCTAYPTPAAAATWSLGKFAEVLRAALGGGSVPSDPTTAGAKMCGGAWFKANFNQCVKGAAANGVTPVSCGVTAWDGVLASGEAANSAARKAGSVAGYQSLPASAESTNGVQHVFSLTCDNQAAALLNDPNVHTRAVAPFVQEFAQAMTAAAKELERCRAGGSGGLSDAQFDVRFNPLSAAGALAMGTTGGSGFDMGVAFNDLYHRIGAFAGVPFASGGSRAVDTTRFGPVAMPSGCTLQDWLQTGVCQFQFRGFSGLFHGMNDLTLRVRIAKCGPRPAVPASSSSSSPVSSASIAIDCVGGNCAEMLAPYKWTYCTQDSDCPAIAGRPPRICQSVKPLTTSVSKLVAGFNGFTKTPFLANNLWVAQGKGWAFGITVNVTGLGLTFETAQVYARTTALDQLSTLCNQMMATGYCPAGYTCGTIDRNAFEYSSYFLDSAQYRTQYLSVYFKTAPLRLTTMTADAISALLKYGYSGGGVNGGPAPIFYGRPNAPVANPLLAIGYTDFPNFPVTFYRCNDGVYVSDQSTCAVADTCDNQANYEADVINFMRTVNGQAVANVDTAPTALRGYCSLASANYTAIAGWYKSAFVTRANPSGTLETTVTGLEAYDCNPTCGNGGGAAGLQPTLAAVAAAIAAVVVLARRF